MTTPLLLVNDAVASRIDEAGLGFWNPTGAYPKDPSVPPIFGKRLPATASGEAIAVNTYSITVSPNPNQPVETVRVQVRCRAPVVADTLADTILGVLHGAHHEQWGPLIIQRCAHISTAQLGLDVNGLDERTDNYELEILSP